MTETPKQAPAQSSRAGLKKELPEHFKAYKHVWVVVECEHGAVHPVSFELLGEGRKLADKRGVELAGVVMGSDKDAIAAVANECFEYGADLVYTVTDPALAHYRNEAYTKAMTDLVKTYKPEILLLGATTLGRDLAGSVATTLLTGLTADCTELAIDDEGSLAATRPTFGGSLLCTILTLNYRPQMATVRPRVLPMPERQQGRRGRIVEHALGLVEDDIVTKVLRFVPDREFEQGPTRFRGYRCRGRTRLEIGGEFPAGESARRGAGCGVRWFAASCPERLDDIGPADWTDRQNNPAEALYRSWNLGCDSAPGGGGGR